MGNEYGTHFQNVFAHQMLRLLNEAHPGVEPEKLEAALEGWMEKSSWATGSLDDLENGLDYIWAGQFEKLLDYSDKQVRDMAIKAGKIAQHSILSAPMRIYNHFGEAGEALREFFADTSRRNVRFGVGAGKDETFILHKEEYEGADLLYGTVCSGLTVTALPGRPLAYLGFVSLKDGQPYALKQPASTCWIGKKHEEYEPYTEESLKKGLTEAVKQEINRRIDAMEPAEPERSSLWRLDDEIEQAIKAFVKEKRVMPFVDRIHIEDYRLDAESLVRFVVDREAVVSELADSVLNYPETIGELRRKRYAVQFAQGLLDALNGSIERK